MYACQKNLKETFENFRENGTFSRELYHILTQLARLVFRSKGVPQDDQDLILSYFLEKVLKYPDSFYLKLEMYQEKQVRAFVAMTIRNCITDFYRQKNQGHDSIEPYLDAEKKESALGHIFEHLHSSYLLEAQAIHLDIWAQLNTELQFIFCSLYAGGARMQDIANEKDVSLGKVDKDKKRIAKAIAELSSVIEVASLVYTILAQRQCTPKGQVRSALQ